MRKRITMRIIHGTPDNDWKGLRQRKNRYTCSYSNNRLLFSTSLTPLLHWVRRVHQGWIFEEIFGSQTGVTLWSSLRRCLWSLFEDGLFFLLSSSSHILFIISLIFFQCHQQNDVDHVDNDGVFWSFVNSQTWRSWGFCSSRLSLFSSHSFLSFDSFILIMGDKDKRRKDSRTVFSTSRDEKMRRDHEKKKNPRRKTEVRRRRTIMMIRMMRSLKKKIWRRREKNVASSIFFPLLESRRRGWERWWGARENHLLLMVSPHHSFVSQDIFHGAKGPVLASPLILGCTTYHQFPLLITFQTLFFIFSHLTSLSYFLSCDDYEAGRAENDDLEILCGWDLISSGSSWWCFDF